MRPFTSTISIDEARRRLNENVTPIDRTEWVPIIEAAGRVAAADVAASIDVPPFSRSAMDGYAVVAADTTAPRDRRRCACASSSASTRARCRPSPSTRRSCAEIATGAPMPDGADAVVMVEETARAGDDAIDVLTPVAPGQHVGRRGGDIASGRSGGAPARCAQSEPHRRAGGHRTHRSRGLRAPARRHPVDRQRSDGAGTAFWPGQIYDVNRFTLSAVVAAHGAAPEPHEPIADTLDDLKDALDAAAMPTSSSFPAAARSASAI